MASKPIVVRDPMGGKLKKALAQIDIVDIDTHVIAVNNLVAKDPNILSGKNAVLLALALKVNTVFHYEGKDINPENFRKITDGILLKTQVWEVFRYLIWYRIQTGNLDGMDPILLDEDTDVVATWTDIQLREQNMNPDFINEED